MDNKKLVCQKCGYEKDVDPIHPNNTKDDCFICGGKMILKKDWQENEEIHQAVDDSNEDEDKTPKQDADEAIEDYLKEQMAEAIARHGNDVMWNLIETTIVDVKARLEYRRLFIAVGGVCPEGQEIKI